MGNVYQSRNLIRLNAAFAVLGIATDPTVLMLNILDPNGALTTLTYGGPDIVRDGIGTYHYDLFVITPGTWYYQWLGTGSAQAATEASFVVELSHFP